jgi:hypothetical protein
MRYHFKKYHTGRHLINILYMLIIYVNLHQNGRLTYYCIAPIRPHTLFKQQHYADGACLNKKTEQHFLLEHANDAIVYSRDRKKHPCISLVNIGDVCI